jgi:hypothetical protein
MTKRNKCGLRRHAGVDDKDIIEILTGHSNNMKVGTNTGIEI